MKERQDWDLAFDPATGLRRRQEDETSGRILPSDRWPNFFSRVVAKLQWDEAALDLVPDAKAYREMPDERRDRLTKLLAGFRIADDAVSVHLQPFGPAANNSLTAWVIYLQRRDEQRHARFFERVAGEVLGLPGETKEERGEEARKLAPPGMVDLFEKELPAMSAEMAEDKIGLTEGLALYHMTLEGMVLSAGQRALLDDLSDGAMPGVRKGVYHVELDERWHIGFGLRLLIDARPSPDVFDAILDRAEEAAAAWGDALPESIRDMIVPMARRRLAYAAKQLDHMRQAA
jgi:ribonucleoside-diphosphate reductase beta chain